MRLCEKGWAVAAFIPPAHTGLYLAAYETHRRSYLPLFCYTAAGWWDDKFYVPAVRIEKDIRQEASGYDAGIIQRGRRHILHAYPHNRLVKHLAENCCLTYHCPAARNYFIGRWECPVPTSPACNANCMGCISFQPQEETIFHTGPVYVQTQCRRDRGIYRASSANGPLPDRQFWTRLRRRAPADVGDHPRSDHRDPEAYGARKHQHQYKWLET